MIFIFSFTDFLLVLNLLLLIFTYKVILVVNLNFLIVYNDVNMLLM